VLFHCQQITGHISLASQLSSGCIEYTHHAIPLVISLANVGWSVTITILVTIGQIHHCYHIIRLTISYCLTFHIKTMKVNNAGYWLTYRHRGLSSLFATSAVQARQQAGWGKAARRGGRGGRHKAAQGGAAAQKRGKAARCWRRQAW
jgi:hypothetical protein